MALELNKLLHEVNDLSTNAAGQLADLRERLPAAQQLLADIGVADEALHAKTRTALGFRWAGAIPTGESVDSAFPPPTHPGRVNIIAADGSQIYPDRHGVALYYLINVGSIVFRCGLNQAPSTATKPEVFFQDADLYEEDGGQIPSVMIDAKRDIRELGELARLATIEAQTAPTVAWLDNGLLLYISLQTPNEKLIDQVLREYLGHLDTLRSSGAAVAGVVDRPRAANVVRLLHLHTLALKDIRDEALRHLGPFQHLTDALIFSFLKPGARSALFVNASPVNLDRYRPRGHTTYFFYLNAGRSGKDSLLRVEVPEWVARDADKLNLIHSTLLEQCRVSDGFPYVLMRAHEIAVITARDRQEFEQMVVGGLVRRGLQPSISQKAQGKLWTSSGKKRYP